MWMNYPRPDPDYHRTADAFAEQIPWELELLLQQFVLDLGMDQRRTK
jgi:hypothetical protein